MIAMEMGEAAAAMPSTAYTRFAPVRERWRCGGDRMFARVFQPVCMPACAVQTAWQTAQASSQVHFSRPAPLLQLLPSLLLPPSPTQPPFPVPSPVHTSWPSDPAHTPGPAPPCPAVTPHCGLGPGATLTSARRPAGTTGVPRGCPSTGRSWRKLPPQARMPRRLLSRWIRRRWGLLIQRLRWGSAGPTHPHPPGSGHDRQRIHGDL